MGIIAKGNNTADILKMKKDGLILSAPLSVHFVDLMLNKSTRTPNFPVKNSKAFSIFPDKRTLLFFLCMFSFF